MFDIYKPKHLRRRIKELNLVRFRVKVSKLCRVLWSWHSAKFRNFAECFGLDTRQTLETYRVFWARHSVKLRNFAECFFYCALGKNVVTVSDLFLLIFIYYIVLMASADVLCRGFGRVIQRQTNRGRGMFAVYIALIICILPFFYPYILA